MSSPATQVRSRVPRVAGAAVERARLTVVPRARSARAARVPFVVLISLVLLGGVVGLLLFNTSMQQASFTITTLEERARNLAAREQELAADLEELRDPQVLATQARRRGMRTPPSLAFIAPDGTVTGVERPARAVDGERISPTPPPLPAELAPRPVVVPAEPPPEGLLRGDSLGAPSPEVGGSPGTTETESQLQQQSQDSQRELRRGPGSRTRSQA